MSTATLSTTTSDRLVAAHNRRFEDGYVSLYALVAALRASGWTLQAIATPLGVSREMVRQWQIGSESMDLPPVTVEPMVKMMTKEEIHREGVSARLRERDRREIAILEDYLPRLKELKPMAEALRGPSRFNPEGAAASAEYTRLIDEALRAGLRAPVLAEALGVQHITLMARLRRSGLRQTAPSEKVPAWAKTAGWQNLVEEVREVRGA